MNEATNNVPAPASGRDIALQRRRALSSNGKAGLAASKPTAMRSAPSPAKPAEKPAEVKAQAAPVTQTLPAPSSSSNSMSGSERARARRQALAQNGKAGLKAVQQGRSRPAVAEPAQVNTAAAELPVEASAAKKEGCGCGCKPGQSPEATTVLQAEAQLDQICETVEANTGVDSPVVSTVRALCLARRQALANHGKAALGKTTGVTRAEVVKGREGAWKNAAAKGLSGRDIARARREELCRLGRGSQATCRPSGRVRPAAESADVPAKVEESSTLRGQLISGTRVERSTKVTGNEPGTCRAITGTEYISLDQYEGFCGTRPAANAAKVGMTRTGRGQAVTGAEVGRSMKVTGDEHGACKSVTGTEYIGAERFDEFCAERLAAAPAKVSAVQTGRGQTVTGAEVGRSSKVTGDETGSCRAITGDEYLNPKASAVPCASEESGDAPKKVGVTRTSHGLAVSGTQVGRSVKVTGDEHGACTPVTGTEYLGAEQFKSFCAADSVAGPRKVQEMATLGGQGLTGTAVGRSVSVTGDEPGSCRQLTGTQYYTPNQSGRLCAEPGAPAKVGLTHTLSERGITGTDVDRSSRVTGNEYGACKPVTGTEYVSAEQYQTLCGSKPASSPAKVGVARTWHQQQVSGTQLGRSGKVTGDEYGGCKPITGTEYIGPDQYAAFCQSDEAAASQERVRTLRSTPGSALTGIQPGINGRMTGGGRGVCMPVSGTPYVGADQFAGQCDTAAASVMNAHHRVSGPADGSGTRSQVTLSAARAAASPSPRVPSTDFSVTTPARSAQTRQTQRITGTAYASSGRVTGPVTLAAGLISGTPEFRYTADEGVTAARGYSAAGAVPVALESEPERKRVTGEGRENGRAITGDDWQRGSRVTGTEGSWAARRNMTQRGESRDMPVAVGARNFKDMEKPQVAPSRVTGSSGNTGSGAAITISGGARG